jgi:hypothetical protein
LPVFPFWGGGGFVPLAGGGAFGLGLVLGGGGGGFCSGAPPGCELGALAGGACSFDGGVFGVVDSFAGGFADEPPPLFELPPQAAAESDSAATHSNNRLRFIRITSQGNSPDQSGASQATFHLRSATPPRPSFPSVGYFLAARFFFLAGSLARDLPKEPR